MVLRDLERAGFTEPLGGCWAVKPHSRLPLFHQVAAQGGGCAAPKSLGGPPKSFFQSTPFWSPNRHPTVGRHLQMDAVLDRCRCSEPGEAPRRYRACLAPIAWTMRMVFSRPLWNKGSRATTTSGQDGVPQNGVRNPDENGAFGVFRHNEDL